MSIYGNNCASMIPFIILLFLVFSLDYYVFSAIRLLYEHTDSLTFLLISGIYWVIPVIMILLVVTAVNNRSVFHNNKYLHHLRSFVFLIYFAKFLAALFLFGDDILRALLFLGGNPLDRSSNVVLLALLFGGIPLVLLIYGIVRNTYRFKVIKQKVVLPSLPKALNSLKIVQLSDIHVGSFKRKDKIISAVKRINDLKPDLIFFTGDLVNSIAAEMNGWIEIFGQLKAKYGVFSIVGNHDYGDYVVWPNRESKRANFERLKAIHAEMGWQLLLNANKILEIGDAKLAIIGVENYSANRRFHQYGDLEKAAKGTEEADVKVLLSHDPSHWNHQVTTKFQDIKLTLSGHTHGFQFGIDLPWFKWSPVKYAYKQWAGLYEHEGQFLYVNRGFGVLGYPGRVGVLPEITVLQLVSH